MPPHEVGDRPEADSADVRVLRIAEGCSSVVRFLVPSYGGMFTHWVSLPGGKGRSVRCHEIKCPLCDKRQRQIWKGYPPVQLWLAKERCWETWLLEVTEHLDVRLNGIDLLGQVWKIERAKPDGKKKQPLTGHYLDTHGAETLPDAFKPEIVLRWLYGPGDYPLNTPNPTPTKVFRTTSQAPPPPQEETPAEKARRQAEDDRKQVQELGGLRGIEARLRAARDAAANGDHASEPTENGPHRKR